MHWKRTCVAFGTALCAAAVAPAGAMAIPTGSISGTVTAASTHAPIANALVCAPSTSGPAGSCAAANAAGEYQITGLSPGTYKVEFEAYACAKPGECVPINYVPQYYAGKAELSEADTITVASTRVEHIDAALQPGGVITGTARDASSHAAISGVEVCALAAGSGEKEHCATSGAGGEYTIIGLSTGAYKIEFNAAGTCSESGCNYLAQFYEGVAGFGEATLVGATSGQTTTGIDAAMGPGARISGKVTNTGGTTLEKVSVCVEAVSPEYFACGFTNAAGEYVVSGLPAASYTVNFYPASGANLLSEELRNVSVSAGQTVGNVDAKLAVGGEIGGKVEAGGVGVGNVRVCALEPASGYPARCGETNTGGEYTIQSVPAGSYKVSFVPPYYSSEAFQYYSAKSTFVAAETISVKAGALTGSINAHLTAGEAITGAIKAGAAPLSNANVCVMEAGRAYEIKCEGTSNTGTYTLQGLPAGSYEVEIYPPGECNLFGCTRLNYLSERLIGITLKAGETKEEGTTELHPGGMIAGAVRDANTHKAIRSGVVCALSASGGVAEEEEPCTLFRNGTYRVAGLPSGMYRMGFYPSTVNYATSYYGGQSTLQAATPVSVQAGGATVEGIDFLVPELFPAAPIETAAPVVSGIAAAGHTLSCSQGGWVGARLITYTYAWLRDGSAIPGQGGATYTVQAADGGHVLACSVTAMNLAGEAGAVSSGLVVPVARLVLPPRGTAVAGRTAIVKGGKAILKLRCTGTGPCFGSLKLTASVVTRRVVKRHGKRHVVRKVRHVVIGRASFSIAVGKSATVKVTLTAKGRGLVAKAGKRGLVVSVSGPDVKPGSVKLEAAKVRHPRKKRHR